MKPTRRRQEGFTLLELVLVTAIFGTVLTMAYQILLTTLEADRRITHNTRNGKIGQAILSLVRRDLQGIVYRGLGVELMKTDDGGNAENAEDALHFLTTAPVPPPPEGEDWNGSIASVGYVLKTRGGDEGHTLFRRVKWSIRESPLEDGAYFPIYDRVSGISFRYLDDEYEWRDEWNAEERIPEEEPEGTGEEEEVPEDGEEEEPELLVLPRAVEIVLYIYEGDEKGLVRDPQGEPILERYSTVVPLLTSESLLLDEESLGLGMTDEEEDSR